jgi:4-hydroxythreonine-4-phosphate dehydrogenase
VCRPVVLGDRNILSVACSSLGFDADSRVRINGISSPSMSKGVFKEIDVVSLSDLSPGAVMPGKPTVAGGRAMVTYIVKAVRMIQFHELDAMVTCPINKALMHEAGYDYEGHTQLIAELTDTDDYVMMLAGKKLRVTLVTIHCALRDVPDLISREAVYNTIRITDMALRTDFAIENPRIAVAALNPHAGEDGLFGAE